MSEEAHLTRRMANGAAWMVLLRLVDRSIGLVSTVILARLLVPADFGLVALATSIIAALELLGAFSFDLALIQNPNAERRHYDTVWTLGLLFGAAYALILLLLALPAAKFYNEPRLTAVMGVLALGTLIGGFVNVGVVAFRKEMQFEKEFKFMFSKRLATFVVTICLAFFWRDYWALVLGTLAGQITWVAMSYAWQPYRPLFSLAARGELFRFSGWLFINNTLGFLYYRVADLIVAKIAGPVGLGYYSIASEISNLPSSELVMPINRAVFPGYAKMSSDLAGMRQGYLNVLSMLGLLAIPAAVGIGCVAAPMVGVFLGPKWVPVIPLIPILAMHGLLTAILSCGNYVFMALGRPRLVTLLLATHVCLAVPMITYGAFKWGVYGVAWALLIASIAVAPVSYFLLSRLLSVRLADLRRVFWRPVTGAIIMAALLMWTQNQGIFDGGMAGLFASLLFQVALGAVTYCIVVALLWRMVKYQDGAELFVCKEVSRRVPFLKKS